MQKQLQRHYKEFPIHHTQFPLLLVLRINRVHLVPLMNQCWYTINCCPYFFLGFVSFPRMLFFYSVVPSRTSRRLWQPCFVSRWHGHSVLRHPGRFRTMHRNRHLHDAFVTIGRDEGVREEDCRGGRQVSFHHVKVASSPHDVLLLTLTLITGCSAVCRVSPLADPSLFPFHSMLFGRR